MPKPPSNILTSSGQAKPKMADPALLSAVDQMFAEFELVYHNQYNKAFSSKEKEDWAKRLWYNNLKEFSAEQIVQAMHKAIKESEFLPTIKGIIKYIPDNKPILPLLENTPEKNPMSKTDKQAALDKLRKESGI